MDDDFDHVLRDFLGQQPGGRSDLRWYYLVNIREHSRGRPFSGEAVGKVGHFVDNFGSRLACVAALENSIDFMLVQLGKTCL